MWVVQVGFKGMGNKWWGIVIEGSSINQENSQCKRDQCNKVKRRISSYKGINKI